jgi:hypothetical protein
VALAGAALITGQGVLFARGPVFREIYGPEITGWELPVAIAGWVLASYGPILAGALLWRWADRFSKGWLLHLLLVPCLYALLLAGARIMLSTVNDPDFDNTLGAPIMPAFFCAFVVLVVYFSALAMKRVSKFHAGSKAD